MATEEPIDLHQAFGSISDLAASGIREVPALFKLPSKIQECLDCSHNGDHENSIPVIDLSQLRGGEDSRTSVVAKIRSALEEWGFLQVINHGVPPALMDDVLQVYKQVFEMMPQEEKLKYFTKDKDATFRLGISRIAASIHPHYWRDFAHIKPQDLDQLDMLPTYPPTLRVVTLAYNEAVIELKRELLNALSESLGLGLSFMDDVAGKGEHDLVASFYPPCPQPDTVMGILPHSDSNTLTVLLQDDVGGLDICDKHQNWIHVKPLKHAFIINVGDQLEILSNGKFKSVEHRVRVNSETARISIGAFFAPKLTNTIGPPSQIVGEEGPLYKHTVYVDYSRMVFTDGFVGKNLIENVKVSNLR